MGVDNVVVELYDGNGNLLATTETGDDFSTAAVEKGFYQFTGLKAGDYQVKFIAPADMALTVKDANGNAQDAADSDADTTSGFSDTITLGVGESNQTIDAGLVEEIPPLPGSLSGRYFMDSDDDNQDNGEAGIAGVQVMLLDAAGDPTGATTTTDADGNYSFDNLSAGSYGVKFTDPDGVLAGKRLVDSNVGPDATDSDAIGDTTESIISNITVTAGNETPDNDAGAEEIPEPGIDIEKFVNGIDVTDLNVLPEIAAGAEVIFTYDVTNTGNVAFSQAEVLVNDDHGTPGDSSDDFVPTLIAASDVGSDGILSAGETWQYTSATMTAQDLSVTTPSDANFVFSGSSSTTGSNGNVRTFITNGVTVDASAHSRTNSGNWDLGYLGAYSSGLGVTNVGEGGSHHRVDNGGREDYLLFEFDKDVTVDRAFLNSVVNDSDISVWIGDRNGADITSLSDSLLQGFTKENDFTSSSSSRWANINDGGLTGDTLVVSAYTGGSNDQFKLNKLNTSVSESSGNGEYINLATVAAGDVSDSDASGYTNPAPHNLEPTIVESVATIPGIFDLLLAV